MGNVLIAYDNDSQTSLHSFFESCADEVKQYCVDNGLQYTNICPPELTEQNVVGNMNNHCVCFIAAHGDVNGVYNNNDEDVITVHTANYDLADKVFYAVSCSCGVNLKQELKRIGLGTFVGYNDVLTIVEFDDSFRECAMSGLKSLLSGDSKEEAKKKMLAKYDECIDKATSPFVQAYLIQNKECLCFE